MMRNERDGCYFIRSCDLALHFYRKAEGSRCVNEMLRFAPGLVAAITLALLLASMAVGCAPRGMDGLLP